MRLEPTSGRRRGSLNIFQFHKGAIRTFYCSTYCSLTLDFNSIKVRLEHAYRENPNYSPTFQFHKGAIRTNSAKSSLTQISRFQFHKGAIRTLVFLLYFLITLLFQFHKGAIRTDVLVGVNGTSLNFNSIKVRLERHHVLDERVPLI